MIIFIIYKYYFKIKRLQEHKVPFSVCFLGVLLDFLDLSVLADTVFTDTVFGDFISSSFSFSSNKNSSIKLGQFRSFSFSQVSADSP